jgi:hypothetical protein
MEQTEKDKLIGTGIDCTNASAMTVKNYFDKGFPVILPKAKWFPFLSWYMKVSDPGSERHMGFVIENDKVCMQKAK